MGIFISISRLPAFETGSPSSSSLCTQKAEQKAHLIHVPTSCHGCKCASIRPRRRKSPCLFVHLTIWYYKSRHLMPIPSAGWMKHTFSGVLHETILPTQSAQSSDYQMFSIALNRLHGLHDKEAPPIRGIPHRKMSVSPRGSFRPLSSSWRWTTILLVREKLANRASYQFPNHIQLCFFNIAYIHKAYSYLMNWSSSWGHAIISKLFPPWTATLRRRDKLIIPRKFAAPR